MCPAYSRPTPQIPTNGSSSCSRPAAIFDLSEYGTAGHRVDAVRAAPGSTGVRVGVRVGVRRRHGCRTAAAARASSARRGPVSHGRHPSPRAISPAAGRGPRRRRAAGHAGSAPPSPHRQHRRRAARASTRSVHGRRARAASSTSPGRPSAQPHLEQHPLDAPGLVVEHLARVRRAGARRRAASAYAAGCLTFHQRTPPTWECAPGSDAPPVAAGPVEEVVPAPARRRRGPSSRPRTSSRPAAASRSSASDVLVGEVVVVRHRQLAALDPPGEGRALLDDQRVRRHVVGLRRRARVSTRRRPVGERLPRRAVDQVEADLLEAGGPRPLDDRRAPAPGRACGRGSRARAARPTACRTRSG